MEKINEDALRGIKLLFYPPPTPTSIRSSGELMQDDCIFSHPVGLAISPSPSPFEIFSWFIVFFPRENCF